jgi:hypothetical protein
MGDHEKLDFFVFRCISKFMSWWKTSIEGRKSVITIYSFNWKFFLALLSAISLGLIAFCLWAWFQSTGPIKLSKISQTSTKVDADSLVYLDLNGNKLQWSQGSPGKTGYLYFEKMGLPRWSPWWAFSPCDAVPITKLKGRMLKGKFYGLLESHGDETRLNWSGDQAIQVEVGQTILARTVKDPQTIYAIQIVSQSTEKEEMDFIYAAIHP